MDWRREVYSYYESKKKKDKVLNKEEISKLISEIIIPAFEDIQVVFSEYAKITIKRFIYKARIRIEERGMYPFVFHVEFRKDSNFVYMPYTLNFYSSGSFIKLEYPIKLCKMDIIKEFMEIFRNREKLVDEHKLKFDRDIDDFEF